MDQRQAWVYHGEAPKAGRKLLLLEMTELNIALPLIFRLVHPGELETRKDWFVSPNNLHEVSHNQNYIDLVECLQLVTENRKRLNEIETLIVKLNDKLNSYFSDFGWRMVRKELSQIKKRQKKSHIELSKDLIIQLKEYMEQHSLDSFDQTIDNLLEEAKEKKKQLD